MDKVKIDYNRHYTIKEMCQVLGYKYNSKNPSRSLAEIERSYELEQISKQRYRIVKELSEDEKIDKWKVTEYKKIFKDITHIILSYSKDNRIWKSDDDYMLFFEMVNKNFKMFTQHYSSETRQRFLEVHDKDIYFEVDAMNFSDEVRQILKRILNETFQQMEEENLITIEYHTILGIPKSYTDGKGNFVIYSEPREATTDEKELLMETETKVLQDNGYADLNKIQQVKNYKERLFLRQEVSRRMGILYYTKQKELILNRYGLNYKVEHNETLHELKRKLNKGTANKVLKSTQGKLKEIEYYRREELTKLLITTSKSTPNVLINTTEYENPH